MKSKIVTLTLILLLLVATRICACKYPLGKAYYVLANKSSECPLNHTIYSACSMLGSYVEHSGDYFTNNTKFVFQKGPHVLENDLLLTVRETFDLILMSESNDEIVIDCRGAISLQFSFINVENVTIENLNFSNCSSPSYIISESSRRTSILGVVNSTNVHLKLVKVWYPRGNGIYLNNIVGQLIMYGIDVVGGHTQSDALTGIYFASCHQSSYVSIPHSRFVNNTNNANDKGVKSPYAGGLAITLKCFDAQVNITNVTFIGNRGGDGGNLAIFFHNVTSHRSSQDNVYSVIINRSLFKKGHGLVGGAIYISFRNSSGKLRNQVCDSETSTLCHPFY